MGKLIVIAIVLYLLWRIGDRLDKMLAFYRKVDKQIDERNRNNQG